MELLVPGARPPSWPDECARWAWALGGARTRGLIECIHVAVVGGRHSGLHTGVCVFFVFITHPSSLACVYGRTVTELCARAGRFA